MIYCIVEGTFEQRLFTAVFTRIGVSFKIIVSRGFPSIPAVARTVMSFMDDGDKVIIVCDQSNFQEGRYGRDMLGFLLRGAMNNPNFSLFVFDPSIDTLIPRLCDNPEWKGQPQVIDNQIRANIETILSDETIRSIITFIQGE